MQVAGDERLSGDTAAGPDHLHREAFCAVIAFFNRNEFVHIAGGDSGNGEPHFLLRGGSGSAFCHYDSRAYERVDENEKSIDRHPTHNSSSYGSTLSAPPLPF